MVSWRLAPSENLQGMSQGMSSNAGWVDRWLRDLSTKFTLADCLLGAVKLNKAADFDKYGFNGYSIGFDTHLNFSVYDKLGKNIIIFGVENSLSVHTDNRRKQNLVFDERPTDG